MSVTIANYNTEEERNTSCFQLMYKSIKDSAYCIQPEKSSPGTGTYDIAKLSDGKKLTKVCYYGTKAAGDEKLKKTEN